MAINPKKSFRPKPKFAMSAHATMRVHTRGSQRRIEIGFRIPPEMEKHLLLELLKRKRLRDLAAKTLG